MSQVRRTLNSLVSRRLREIGKKPLPRALIPGAARPAERRTGRRPEAPDPT
jgi:hypothetical protein